jgi:hypothetical protein
VLTRNGAADCAKALNTFESSFILEFNSYIDEAEPTNVGIYVHTHAASPRLARSHARTKGNETISRLAHQQLQLYFMYTFLYLSRYVCKFMRVLYVYMCKYITSYMEYIYIYMHTEKTTRR